MCVCVCVCESVWVSLCVSVSVCVLREQGHLGDSPQAQRHLQNTLPQLQLIFFLICPINVPNGNMVSLPQSP